MGSADAKAMLLRHPGFLDTLLNSIATGRSSNSSTSTSACISGHSVEFASDSLIPYLLNLWTICHVASSEGAGSACHSSELIRAGSNMRSPACADGEQPNARLESHLWLLSALVQSSREAQSAALRCLPDLTQLLDTGATRMHPGNLRSKTSPLQHLQPVISARAWVHAEQCWLTTPMRCGMHTGPGECQWRRTSECWHAELGCCRAGHKPRCSRGRGAEQPGGPERACADCSPECWRAGKASQVMESNPCCCPVHRHEAGSRGQACCGSRHEEVAKAASIGLRR